MKIMDNEKDKWLECCDIWGFFRRQCFSVYDFPHIPLPMVKALYTPIDDVADSAAMMEVINE